jgi:hypothetical protein
MDRREVHDVEAHLRDLGLARLGVRERAVFAMRRGRRARKELVPARETGTRAIDDERKRDRIRCFEAPVRIAHRESGTRLVERELAKRLDVGRLRQRLRPFDELPAIVAARTSRGARDDVRADLRGDTQIVGVDATLEIVPPRQEGIDPGRDRVALAADLRHDELTAPAVVAERDHR